MQILSAIPLEWKQTVLNSPGSAVDRMSNYEKLNATKKISHIVYDKLIDNSASVDKKRLKWINRLGCDISEQEFLTAFVNILSPTIYTKLRDFQYRLLHNLVVTNFNLKCWRMRIDDLCTFCNSQREFTCHLFIECPVISRIWNQLQDYICSNNAQLSDYLTWSNKNIMFNLVHPIASHIVNLLVLITEQYIYRSRCKIAKPTIDGIIFEIEQIKEIEYGIARQKGKLNKHYDKWSQLFPEMEMSEQEIQTQRAFIDNYLSLL